MARAKDARELIDGANAALQLYANFWGSSTKDFATQFDLILKVLDASGEHLESPFDKALVRAYVDGLKAKFRSKG